MEVHREDCEFDGVVAQPFGIRRGAPSAAGPSEEVVFVQHARNCGDFKQVTPATARQIYGVGDGRQTRRGRCGKRENSNQKSVSARSWTFAEVAAASLDADVAALAGDGVERGIFEFLAQGERWHLLVAASTCLCQGVLAGLSLVAGSIATSAYVGGERLAEALGVLEPILSGLSLSLAEAALVGCVLRALHARDGAVAKHVTIEIDSPKHSTEQDCPGRLAVRQQSILQVTLGSSSALANAAVVSLCLLGQRNDMRRASGLVPWMMVGDDDNSNVWSPDQAFLLLALRAAFGLFALGPTLLDLQSLVVPALSPSGLAHASGLAPGGPV